MPGPKRSAAEKQSAHDTVRWALIEYQPNLRFPKAPIVLGLITERLSNGQREIQLVGRDDLEALGVDGLWGPFQEQLVEWFRNTVKDIEKARNAAAAASYVIDALATQAQWNLYVRRPETLSLASGADLAMESEKLLKSKLMPTQKAAALRRHEFR